MALVIRNNVLADCQESAVWEDCWGQGLLIYGNTLRNLRGDGFYIEAGVKGTVLEWNTVMDCSGGIGFRENWANVAYENYFLRNHRAVGVGSCDSFIPVRADTVAYNWMIDNEAGCAFGPNTDREPAQLFDHNVYKFRKPAGKADPPVILQYGNKPYRDLAELRREVGQEIHGKVIDQFDPAPLGLVTFRIPGAKKSWEAVPMIGNPTAQRVDALQAGRDCPYFWRKGSFRGAEPYGWRGAGNGWNGEGCGFASVTRGDGTGFLRMLMACSAKWDKGPFDDPAAIRKLSDDPAAIKDDANNGLACLQIASYPPDKTISDQGYGFWSTELPTTDDARIDLSLWVMARHLKAAKAGGGLFAAVEFRDEVGQHVTRQYLAGGDDGQTPLGAAWMTGNYQYKLLRAGVTAPKGARWFTFGVGLRNCTGWVALGDLDIQTHPAAHKETDQ
jgi:hypothetical protein